jgi:hypothetical protein
MEAEVEAVEGGIKDHEVEPGHLQQQHQQKY